MYVPANSADQEWKRIIGDLIQHGEFHSPRGKHTTELLNYHSRIDMRCPVITNPLRKMGYRFMAAEVHWILSGDSRVETILPYAKHLSNFTDDGYRFQGAYGPMVTEQLRYVVEALHADRDTRQAVLTVWRQNPRQSRDIPCTISLQFLIRNHKIHCIANMRSSDIWLGWVYDIFNFTMITTMIAVQLFHRFKMRVELGELHINAGSQHLYDINRDAAVDAQQDPFTWSYSPLDCMSFDNPDVLYKYLIALRDRDWDWIGDGFMKELKEHVT